MNFERPKEIIFGMFDLILIFDQLVIFMSQKVKEKSNPLTNESYVFHVNCKTKKNVIFLTNELDF